MGSREQPSEAATSFLASLPEQSLERLRGLAKPVRLATGDWLFHEGDEADFAYIIESGRVHVVSDGQIIRTVRRGAVIGELAPLTGGTRTASVRAQRDGRLWRLGRDEFEQLISADQQFALALCRTLGSKLAEHRSPVSQWQPARRIAIVALSGEVSTDNLADALRPAWRRPAKQWSCAPASSPRIRTPSRRSNARR